MTQAILKKIENECIRTGLPEFRSGDTIKVHAKIIEGTKERIQIFEGIVIKKHGDKGAEATFTVRKVSYNIGVERTFYVNSPRIDKIEIVARGQTRRARLFYLRPLRGKSARVKTRYTAGSTASPVEAISIESASSEMSTSEATIQE
jgi:large subunit ribosomal protein L19